MNGLKFYLAMLTLMLDKGDETSKPRKRRGNQSRRARLKRHMLGNRPTRPKKSLRGGQTVRPKNRSSTPQH